jgi:hypothetical protein
MSDTLRLLALNCGIAAAGAVVVALAGVPLRAGWLPTVAGLAPAAGLAGCGIAAALGAMVGIDVSPHYTALITIVAVVIAWLVVRRRPPGIGALTPPRQGLVARTFELVCLALLAALSVRIVGLNAATGLDVWDGWAMWAPKAHALFVEGDVWGPVFTAAPYQMQHEEYPVLFPALEALSSGAIGRFDPRLIDIESAAVVVAFGWGAWAILRLVVLPAVAAGVALWLTGSASLIQNGAANYADSVLAAFTALGLLCLLVWLTKGADALLVLAALFLGAAASTKAEGLLFAVAAIVAAIATARGFGRPLRPAILFGAGVLAVPAVWAVVDHLNGPGAKNVEPMAFVDPSEMLDSAHRIPTAIARLTDEIVDGWPLISIAVVVAIGAACVARLWWHAAFVALWGFLAFCALVGVYYASTAPIDWHLGTSADRVVLSIVLALATMAPVLVWQVWEQTVRCRDDVLASTLAR